MGLMIGGGLLVGAQIGVTTTASLSAFASKPTENVGAHRPAAKDSDNRSASTTRFTLSASDETPSTRQVP
jgi:hypothetical protein